jgi:hypothetical protein
MTGLTSVEIAEELAERGGVCVRPLLREVTDQENGRAERLTLPCGSTRASVCPSCAERARRLRMHQCSEGWHLSEDPLREPSAAPATNRTERRVRSTRRRIDAADLPRVAAEQRSVGRAFTAPNGRTYRPSMFVTLTLGSYGRVVPGKGYPVDPDRYDYRRAAVEALLFPRLFDRWMQNLRRCAGYRVQYFGAIEPQRRLAPHIHLAIRGAIPRGLIREVTRATYVQMWWPSFEVPLYVDEPPVWDRRKLAYCDPATRAELPKWDDAVDALDEPTAVLGFGNQLDIQGLLGHSVDSDRRVRYLAKYLTKSVSEAYVDEDGPDPAYEAHIDRLHDDVRWLPCSPECANWLRYGVQPRHASPGLVPGRCASRAHDRENLGLGGRRVQVSRHWTGKTLRGHRADRAAVVRAVLAEAGIEAPAVDRLAARPTDEDAGPRFVWESVRVTAQEYAAAIIGSVVERRRWRLEYELARQSVRAGPVDTHSATAPPRSPDRQPSPVAGVAVQGERSESRSDRRPLTAASASTPWADGRPRPQHRSRSTT